MVQVDPQVIRTRPNDSEFIITVRCSHVAVHRSLGSGAKFNFYDVIVMALDEQVNRHKATWTWTKGHANHVDNNRCDELATRAARDQSKN